MKKNNMDPAEQALASLRNQRWTGGSSDSNLENRLMQEFKDQDVSLRFRFPKALAATLAILLVGGAGFAAAGGVETVKRWLVTVELIGPDGEVFIGTLEPISDNDNTAIMDLQMADGKTATLTIERLEASAVGLEGGSDMTMRVVVETDNVAGFTTSDGSAPVQFELKALNPTGTNAIAESGSLLLQRMDEFQQTQSLEQIPEALVVEPYIDQNDIWQELHIVGHSDVNGGGLTIYTTFITDSGEVRYREVGALQGVNPAELSIESVAFNDEGFAAITIVGENAKTIDLEVSLDRSWAAPGAGLFGNIQLTEEATEPGAKTKKSGRPER